jgi:hypothetical protein
MAKQKYLGRTVLLRMTEKDFLALMALQAVTRMPSPTALVNTLVQAMTAALQAQASIYGGTTDVGTEQVTESVSPEAAPAHGS